MSEDEDRKEMLDKLNSSVPVVQPPAPVAEPLEEIKKNFDEDYNYTREKLKGLVEKAEDAIDHYVDIAKERNSARDFEVLGNMLKNTADMVKSVIDTAASKAQIDVAKHQKVVGEQQDGGTVTNNTTIFVGSTKELLDKINQESAKVIDV